MNQHEQGDLNARTRARTKTFEVWFMNIETRDFYVETIQTASLKAAREYGRERERDTDYLRFRDVEAVR